MPLIRFFLYAGLIILLDLRNTMDSGLKCDLLSWSYVLVSMRVLFTLQTKITGSIKI